MTAGPYRIDRTSNWRRKAVEDWLFGLDLLSPKVREDVVTAWASAWASSTHERLEDMPFSPSAAGVYPLTEHVNEVTRAGVDLGRRAAADWGVAFDRDALVSILILHDLDKPLLYRREGGGAVHTELYHELPHGVIGAAVALDGLAPASLASYQRWGASAEGALLLLADAALLTLHFALTAAGFALTGRALWSGGTPAPKAVDRSAGGAGRDRSARGAPQ